MKQLTDRFLNLQEVLKKSKEKDEIRMKTIYHIFQEGLHPALTDFQKFEKLIDSHEENEVKIRHQN